MSQLARIDHILHMLYDKWGDSLQSVQYLFVLGSDKGHAGWGELSMLYWHEIFHSNSAQKI